MRFFWVFVFDAMDKTPTKLFMICYFCVFNHQIAWLGSWLFGVFGDSVKSESRYFGYSNRFPFLPPSPTQGKSLDGAIGLTPQMVIMCSETCSLYHKNLRIAT